jgi:hypothetical protein
LQATIVFWAWFVMAVCYSASGIDKAWNCPSWRDGSALRHILEGPLARDNALRLALLAAPDWVLRVATWASLALEIGFGPACMLKGGRQAASLAMIGMHLGILAVINFTDLSIGVLMLHLFTAPSLLRAGPLAYAWRNVLGMKGPPLRLLTRYDAWFPAFCALLGGYLAVHFFQVRAVMLSV